MKAKKLTLSKFDFERGISAQFKYTVSRGAETYGYNICTLYINGEKVSSCNGGGYDMRGTALGDWIEVQWPDEIKALPASFRDKKGFQKGFYGLTHRDGKSFLDGACGISCMQDVLTAIGYGMRWIPTRKKNDDLYMIEPVQVTK